MPGTRLFIAIACLFACEVASSSAAGEERPLVADSGIKPEKPAVGTIPTLWIAGDSTAKNSDGMRGWGQDLGHFFDSKKITIVNHAIAGRSSRTFYIEGRWQKILDAIKPGDWVVVQFGLNDGGKPDASSKFRASLKGVGEETQDVTKPDGTVETVHTFGWYMKNYALTARAKGANVILCSPIPHKKFDSSGKFVRDWEDLSGWVAGCADEENAYYIDLCELIARGYDKLTQPEIDAFFADKGTNTSEAGSLFNARAFVAGMKSLPRNPLGPYFAPETPAK